MKIKMSGFDEFKNKLRKLEQNIKELEQTTSVAFSELFTSDFMHHHTSFSSIEELFEAGNFKIDTNDDFEKISDDVLNTLVSKHTDFSSWQEMLDEAGSEYVANKLDL